MRTIYVLLFAAVLAVIPIQASSKDRHPDWVDYTGTHELDVSVGFPTAYGMAATVGMMRGFAYISNWSNSLLDGLTGNDSEQRLNVDPSGDNSFVPNLRLEYGYNALSWLNIGVAVNYSSASMGMNYLETEDFAWTEKLYLTTATVKIKFYWLNRKLVRMYSSVGAGVGICKTNAVSVDEADAQTYSTAAVFIPDVCLLGLTVGKNVYGRVEIGTLLGGVTAGIGFRF